MPRSNFETGESHIKLLGYGEDSLTLWAIIQHTRTILDKLDDDSTLDDVVIYYRPSFGRRGSAPPSPGDVADSSQFGEFDSILATPKSVYLIETKWSRSPECAAGAISLRKEQTFRHQLFRAYFEAWRETPDTETWEQFTRRQNGFLVVDERSYPIAPVGSQLARNLETILDGLSSSGPVVQNVLLFISTQNTMRSPSAPPDRFALISLQGPVLHGFVDISPVIGTTPPLPGAQATTTPDRDRTI